jgi:hypothetical protein
MELRIWISAESLRRDGREEMSLRIGDVYRISFILTEEDTKYTSVL